MTMKSDILISKPLLGEEEISAIRSVIDSGILVQGPKTAEFERAFADFIGVKHAIATSSGTTALIAALVAHDIGHGDEVITTPFTFVATINAILLTGAKPVFVDIGEDFNINAQLIEEAITPRTRAILPVHLYGQPADMEKILQIAQSYKIPIIEDACQAHGASIHGRRVGSFGTGVFSFYATKNMTTGEGGMVTTNDDKIAEKIRLFINHGMRERYYHERIGYNFRMTEIAAAIGLEQLKKLPKFNHKRIENALFFNEKFKNINGLLTPLLYPDRVHVFHQYTLRITPELGLHRDRIVELMTQKGIGIGIYYPIPVHKQRYVKPYVGDKQFPFAEKASTEVLSLPVHPSITEEQREYIANTLLAIVRHK